MAKISFNGQEYDSPEAMPPEVQQLYQMMTSMLGDKNQDGVPDIFVGDVADSTKLFQTTQFIVDGQAYSSLDALPAEARQKYQQALGQFDANRNGIPDMLENSAFGTVRQPAAAAPATPPYQGPKVTVIGDPQPARRVTFLLIAGVVLFLVALYLFTR